MRIRAAGLILGISLVGACSGTSDAPAPPAAEVQADLPEFLPAQVRVDALDLATLQALESRAMGASLGAVLARVEGVNPPSSDRLGQLGETLSLWRALSDTLAVDLQEVIDGVKRPLVTQHVHALRWPSGNVGRAFDTDWLRSEEAFFTLAGVVNRLDRRDLHASPSCGEVRLIYRLTYQADRKGRTVSSRLPLTLNVVLLPDERTDCAAVAQQWTDLPDGPALAALLRAGPLDFKRLRLDRIEVNAQVVRFPSGLETEFGGQALYLLKVYAPGMGAIDWEVTAKPLENTPDVGRLQQDPALRAELAEWIGANVVAIDQGTYLVPERFLAFSALSYSTLGVNRLANKPFSALFAGDRLGALPVPTGELRFVGAREGLVERLDNGSCTGCHQAASTAGFHLLGPDDPGIAGVTNRLSGSISPHLAAERKRRRQYAADIASRQVPDTFRPHSLAPAAIDGAYPEVLPNQACLPTASAAGVVASARWGCDQASGPTTCEVVALDERVALNFGQCIPRAAAPQALAAGMTCRAAVVDSQGPVPGASPWNLHAYDDTVALQPIYPLPEDPPFTHGSLHCRPTRIGVPLGRTYRRCTRKERTLGSVQTGRKTSPEICAVVGGKKFDLCVEGDFHSCLGQIVARGMVATCSPELPCREDAICQTLPWQLAGVPDAAGKALAEAGVGFCTPTYFLFQLRLDGHPVPTVAGGA